MWCVLYLSDRPLSAAELGERLQLSTGAVSMTLSELLKWGAVKKSWVPGERRDYYEPETSIWKMVSRVFRERELRQIHAALEAFELVIGALGKRRKTAGLEEVQRLDFALGRIRSLYDLGRIGEKLLGAVLAGEPVDASPLVAFKKDEEEGPP
jgi:DNA-binding transcriptional regulator GbsR (MarR family)